MRKSKRVPPPAPFVYLREVLPELVKTLRASLLKDGERELAETIPELRIYARCCDCSPCGRFYCLSKEERDELHRKGLAHNLIGTELVVAKGKIVEVETYSSKVDQVLRQIFPAPEHPAEASGSKHG